MIDPAVAWRNLIAAAVVWDQFMDQWDKAEILLSDGRKIYLTLGSSAQYPESFDTYYADGSTRPVRHLDKNVADQEREN